MISQDEYKNKSLGADKHDDQRLMIIVIAVLYFAQGIPLGFTFFAFPAMLRTQGAPLELIAWVPMLGLPWAFKFLWAPIVDNHWVDKIGRRKTWLLSMQFLMIFAMTAIAFSFAAIDNLSNNAMLPLTFLFIASIVSATQDIVTDGLAAERLQGGALVNANSLSVGGMMAGVMVGGAGTLLVVESLGFIETILSLAAILILCAIPVLMWQEASSAQAVKTARASLWQGIKRQHFWPIFLVVSIYAVAHTTETTLTKLFLIDSGWDLGKIGVITTIGSISMIVLGCGLASKIVVHIGTWLSASIGLIIGAITILVWIYILHNSISPNLILAASLSAFGAMGLGITAVAMFTIAMKFSGASTQTGTDVTLFKSGNVIGEIVTASVVTLVAATAGYSSAFVVGLAFALLTVLLILLVAKVTKKLNLNK